MQIWESVKNCQNYRFLKIFWDILDKMKSNFGQECIRREHLTLKVKTGTNVSDFHRKK